MEAQPLSVNIFEPADNERPLGGSPGDPRLVILDHSGLWNTHTSLAQWPVQIVKVFNRPVFVVDVSRYALCEYPSAVLYSQIVIDMGVKLY